MISECSKRAFESIYVRMPNSGIYSITNVQTRKVYYGSSNDIARRWQGHKSKLRKGKHPNPHLQNSWNKYGESSFVFKIEEIVLVSELQHVEQCYLEWCKLFSQWSYNKGYDSKSPTRGLKFGPPSLEHRRKIGLANSGENSPNYGKNLSVETRRKMSVAQRGIHKPTRTEEHKKNIGLACNGSNHWRYDKVIYMFYHPEIGIETCTRHDLKQKYGLHKRSLGMIIEGKRRSYRQWRLL